MTQTLTLICEHCGKSFESNRKKRFCSEYCQYRHRYEGKGKRQYSDTYIPRKRKTRSCKYCGQEFDPTSNGQLYCSSKCQEHDWWEKNRRKELRCVICGNIITGENRTGRKYCSDECRNKSHVKICKECGKEFISYHGQKYCSHECASKAQTDKTLYVCKQCGKVFHRRKKIEDQCLFCSRECSAKYKSEHRPMIQREFFFGFETKCFQCGKTFFSNNGQQKFCSDECKQQWNNEHAKPIRIFYHECQQCGKKFVTALKTQKFCSIECQKKSYDKKHEIRRRTRKRINGNADYTISLEKLYKRDHGICAICGRSVNMKADTNSDEYGSIDHIIPLVKGGTHTWENVQLAHRICNSIKSDN